MKKRKLNYRFHNPNTVEAATDMLLQVFIEANSKKVEMAVQEKAEELIKTRECDDLIGEK